MKRCGSFTAFPRADTSSGASTCISQRRVPLRVRPRESRARGINDSAAAGLRPRGHNLRGSAASGRCAAIFAETESAERFALSHPLERIPGARRERIGLRESARAPSAKVEARDSPRFWEAASSFLYPLRKRLFHENRSRAVSLRHPRLRERFLFRYFASRASFIGRSHAFCAIKVIEPSVPSRPYWTAAAAANMNDANHAGMYTNLRAIPRAF